LDLSDLFEKPKLIVALIPSQFSVRASEAELGFNQPTPPFYRPPFFQKRRQFLPGRLLCFPGG